MKKGGSLANLPDKTRDDGGAITSTCHHRLNNLSLFMPCCQGKRFGYQLIPLMCALRLWRHWFVPKRMICLSVSLHVENQVLDKPQQKFGLVPKNVIYNQSAQFDNSINHLILTIRFNGFLQNLMFKHKHCRYFNMSGLFKLDLSVVIFFFFLLFVVLKSWFGGD